MVNIINIKASLILNVVLLVALIFSLIGMFRERSAIDQATNAARNWKYIAAQGSTAYVVSHKGTLPKGTSVLSNNGAVFVVGFTNIN